ncbi:MAG: hypothetical protein J6D57_10420 [Mogibacterium sp.]|nr:hypothetical protein [Mogibacterium sp.]MBP3898225.1 hypothetical protein [Mogibacterium sp.]
MLTYDNLIQEAQTELPNFKTKYDQLIEDDVIDTESGKHIVFGYAFTPALSEAITNKDEETAKKMFLFLEKMASSEDNRVVEVCDQSVLEELNDEFDENTLKRYMRANTAEGYKALKQYMR